MSELKLRPPMLSTFFRKLRSRRYQGVTRRGLKATGSRLCYRWSAHRKIVVSAGLRDGQEKLVEIEGTTGNVPAVQAENLVILGIVNGETLPEKATVESAATGDEPGFEGTGKKAGDYVGVSDPENTALLSGNGEGFEEVGGSGGL
jgi:hypothetical protein